MEFSKPFHFYLIDKLHGIMIYKSDPFCKGYGNEWHLQNAELNEYSVLNLKVCSEVTKLVGDVSFLRDFFSFPR